MPSPLANKNPPRFETNQFQQNSQSVAEAPVTAEDIISGLISTSRLGTGTADSSKYLRGDQTWATPAGSAGTTTGTTEVDFGTHPGSTYVTVDVIGQTGITTSMKAFAVVAAEASADHSVDEHVLEDIKVTTGNIIDGVGFSIYVKAASRISGVWNINWMYA